MLCFPIFREPTSSKDERYASSKYVVSQHLFPFPVAADILGSPLESTLEPDARGEETEPLPLAKVRIEVIVIHIEITIDAECFDIDEKQQATLQELNPDRRAAFEDELPLLTTLHLHLLDEYFLISRALLTLHLELLDKYCLYLKLYNIIR